MASSLTYRENVHLAFICIALGFVLFSGRLRRFSEQTFEFCEQVLGYYSAFVQLFVLSEERRHMYRISLKLTDS